MEKTVDYYMNLPYTVKVINAIGGGLFATVEELPGCMADGETWAELGESLEISKRLWLETALEIGMKIPEPAPVQS